ncbi:MAG TPA: hypothetical protein VFD37_02480 [Solirubrobacterales bacterium]|nr:hypothetical protein [Solirubrobacterales bacterium]
MEVRPGFFSSSLSNRGPYETYRSTTLCGEQWQDPREQSLWSLEWGNAHREELIPLDSEPEGRDLIAAGSIVRDTTPIAFKTTGTERERTLIELWHAPGPRG